jgi:hypothetical protein
LTPEIPDNAADGGRSDHMVQEPKTIRVHLIDKSGVPDDASFDSLESIWWDVMSYSKGGLSLKLVPEHSTYPTTIALKTGDIRMVGDRPVVDGGHVIAYTGTREEMYALFYHLVPEAKRDPGGVARMAVARCVEKDASVGVLSKLTGMAKRDFFALLDLCAEAPDATLASLLERHEEDAESAAEKARRGAEDERKREEAEWEEFLRG